MSASEVYIDMPPAMSISPDAPLRASTQFREFINVVHRVLGVVADRALLVEASGVGNIEEVSATTRHGTARGRWGRGLRNMPSSTYLPSRYGVVNDNNPITIKKASRRLL